MKITNTIFYKNKTDYAVNEGQQLQKNVLLMDNREMATAIDKGTLTVDGVTLELSEEVREAIEKAKEQQAKDNEMVNMMNMLLHNAEVTRQQKDAMEKVVDDQAKALEIARRISKGGQVPYQDEQALMEYSTELYQMSKQAAMMAKEHKKYDSILEEESKESGNQETETPQIDTRYGVQVEVEMGEKPSVESVSEVAMDV